MSIVCGCYVPVTGSRSTEEEEEGCERERERGGESEAVESIDDV
jgi:hypothetical protein